MSFFNKIMDKAKHHSHSSSKDSGRPFSSNGENSYVTPPASATPGRSIDSQAQNDSSRMSIDSPGKYTSLFLLLLFFDFWRSWQGWQAGFVCFVYIPILFLYVSHDNIPTTIPTTLKHIDARSHFQYTTSMERG